MQIITEAEIDEAGWGSVNTPEEAKEESLITPSSQNGEGHKTVKSILTWFFFFSPLQCVMTMSHYDGCVCQWPFNLQLMVDWRRHTHTHTLRWHSPRMWEWHQRFSVALTSLRSGHNWEEIMRRGICKAMVTWQQILYEWERGRGKGGSIWCFFCPCGHIVIAPIWAASCGLLFIISKEGPRLLLFV